MSDYSFQLDQLPTSDDLVDLSGGARPHSLYDNLSVNAATNANAKPKPQIPVKPVKKFQFNDIKFQFEEIPDLSSTTPATTATPPTLATETTGNGISKVSVTQSPSSLNSNSNSNVHNNSDSFTSNDSIMKPQYSTSTTSSPSFAAAPLLPLPTTAAAATNSDPLQTATSAHRPSSAVASVKRDYINYNKSNGDYTNNNNNNKMNKSVLSDAKLVFFGLNGANNSNPTSDSNNTNNSDKDMPGSRPPSAAVRPASSPTPTPNGVANGDEPDNETSQLIEAANGERRATILAEENSPNNKNGISNNNENGKNNKNLPHQLAEGYQMTYQRSPSQAVYMSTTVPQNIKSNNIIGRHTPTRTSLRHSRMLVVNKNYQARSMNQLQIKCPILAKISLICKVAIGICLCAISMWLLLWAPNTRMRDNPYWSGALLIVSGIIGIIVVEFKSTRQNRMKTNCFNFLKINSTIITILTLFFTVLAFIYAFIHFHNLTIGNKQCVPENSFSPGSPCICNFGINNDVFNATSIFFGSTGFELHYRDLNCMEVLGPWYYIIMASTILNFLGFICCAIYLTLFSIGCNKQPQQEYSNVRTNPS